MLPHGWEKETYTRATGALFCHYVPPPDSRCPRMAHSIAEANKLHLEYDADTTREDATLEPLASVITCARNSELDSALSAMLASVRIDEPLAESDGVVKETFELPAEAAMPPSPYRMARNIASELDALTPSSARDAINQHIVAYKTMGELLQDEKVRRGIDARRSNRLAGRQV